VFFIISPTLPTFLFVSICDSGVMTHYYACPFYCNHGNSKLTLIFGFLKKQETNEPEYIR